MRIPSMILLVVLASASSTVSAADGTQKQQTIAPIRTTQLTSGGGIGGPGDEQRTNEFDKRLPNTGTGLARVPASHVPQPTPNNVTVVNSGFSGFAGLTNADQRFAGTGPFTNSQFNIEPPDQGLCVGNGFVLEQVNLAVAAYRTDGTRVAGPTPLNQFFGLAPAVVRSNPPVFGDFTSDPKCYFDPDLQRWFVTLLQADIDPATGGFTGPTHVLVAVSTSADPTGTFRVFVIDTTNRDHRDCPCLGDQPLIGADANGFYVSTNEFSLFGSGFNGPQLYAMSKQKLAAGQPLTVVQFSSLALREGTVFTIQPATTPQGGGYELGAGGTAYFLNSFFTGGLENRIVLWALTNTSSLTRSRPAVTLTHAILDTEVYGFPPSAEQQDGPTPLGDAVNGKLEFLDANDDRMQQVVLSKGLLWGALASPIKTPNSPTKAGVAWFAIRPSVQTGAAAGTVAGQGYVSVADANLVYPAVAVNAAGKATVVFTLAGPTFLPSAAYAVLDLVDGAGDVHIAADGATPQDGFTGYAAFGFPRAARWGDYGAAVADETGNLWMATEFIPNAPRTASANWGTFIVRITP